MKPQQEPKHLFFWLRIKGAITAMALIGWIFTAMISRVGFVSQTRFQLLIMKQRQQLLLMVEMVLVELLESLQ